MEMETEGGCAYVVQAGDVDASTTSPADRWWISVAARVFPALATTSKAKRERKSNRLQLNGDATAATNTAVVVGDRITYTPLRVPHSGSPVISADEATQRSPKQWLAVCVRQGMRVVYENDEFAVIVKPVGIHVKGRGQRTVEYALPALLRGPCESARGSAVLPSPHAMHRLDYRVGGLLLIAKTRSAEVSLAGQFEAHQVVKQYRAILVGRLDPSTTPELSVAPPEEFAVSSTRLSATSGSGTVEKAPIFFFDAPLQGKRSCTALVVRSVTPSARYEWLTTVDLWPLTGRWHQLRLHMASLGHPIVGDDLHHSSRETASAGFTPLPDVVRGAGLFLHATGITFYDAHGMRHSFAIDEPHKFSRFRHFCTLNRQKQTDRARRTSIDDREEIDRTT